MADERKPRIGPYEDPAGGWGSVKSVVEILKRERVPIPSTVRELWRQNKPRGFTCVSCAWPQPAKPAKFEFCENGAKASAWELTSLRTTPEFFTRHTCSELLGWSDHDLEQQGRLTHPMRYDRATDKYVQCEWDEAFRAIGSELKQLDPKSVVFYASGRASLETSYLYALFARLYGNNNLPDSSNMCHEATGVALRKSVGSAVGTVVLDDFAKTDCIVFFGQNAGVNSPRMLHDLQRAAKRGVPIIVFNPLRERGLERFTNPQSPIEMLAGKETPLATQYLQVRAGGDIAAIAGLCKALLALDDEARRGGDNSVLDQAFIAQHCHGFDEFAAFVRAQPWADIEAASGLAREDLERAAATYAKANAVIGVYGMGLTQHVLGEYNIHMVANLLLMRGNIGKPGAGLCPVRGHSNVQGQRTVGIADDPALVPLDRLAQQYDFEPPRDKGLNTVECCEGVLKGTVHGFIGLGGNFLRAIPEQERVNAAWSKLRLTVQIATKLNRSHLVNGEVALPAAVPRPHRARGRERQGTSALDRGFHQLHPRFGGQGGSGEPGTEVRNAHRGGTRKSHAAAESEGSVGYVGRRFRDDPGRDRADLSGPVQGFQHAHVATGRFPSTKPGARTRVEDIYRQGQLHRAALAYRHRFRGRTGSVPVDDDALQRSVQYHGVRL